MERALTGAPPPDLTAAPALETERLRLRAHRADDLDACAEMWADPAVVRYTIGTPSTRQKTWMRLLAYRGHWALLGYGYWAVEEKLTGRYIGELGFADFRRDGLPAIEGLPELGWALLPRAQGRGYATEALRAAVAWGDRRFGAQRTACLIHRDNLPSFRVAGKLGYTIFATASDDGALPAVLLRTPV